jgi:hypothetical protein
MPPLEAKSRFDGLPGDDSQGTRRSSRTAATDTLPKQCVLEHRSVVTPNDDQRRLAFVRHVVQRMCDVDGSGSGPRRAEGIQPRATGQFRAFLAIGRAQRSSSSCSG